MRRLYLTSILLIDLSSVSGFARRIAFISQSERDVQPSGDSAAASRTQSEPSRVEAGRNVVTQVIVDRMRDIENLAYWKCSCSQDELLMNFWQHSVHSDHVLKRKIEAVVGNRTTEV